MRRWVVSLKVNKETETSIYPNITEQQSCQWQ